MICLNHFCLQLIVLHLVAFPGYRGRRDQAAASPRGVAAFEAGDRDGPRRQGVQDLLRGPARR